MATLAPHVFNSFILTEEEQAEAIAGINPLTLMLMHNMIATALEEKAMLAFDPKDPMDFIQKEAYLKGQADILLNIVSNAMPVVV